MAKHYVKRGHVPVVINGMSARVLAPERLKELEARDPMNLGRDVTLDYIVDVRYEEKPADRWHIEIAPEGVHTVIPFRVFERMANYIDQVKAERAADRRKQMHDAEDLEAAEREVESSVAATPFLGQPEGDVVPAEDPEVLQGLQDRDERRVSHILANR